MCIVVVWSHMHSCMHHFPFVSNRPFAYCIDYLTDYCMAKYIAPVVVSVCDTATLHAQSWERTITLPWCVCNTQ